ncbi:DUF2058 domain-containing protein [Dongshaea marina]|uniref:DUF2058 domain-containing protein n=1 Tax=Dongshaea marina TaxID=2047966 RepID=UPI000D3EB9C3|nr:DUF2058 domain-containing protein [Dongshaea marina]
MSSLQEQLLKAGLTNEKKLKKTKAEKHARIKKQPKKKKGHVEVSELQQEIQRQQQERKERDLELNKKQQQILALREERARVKQLIEHHSDKSYAGDIAYNFSFDNKVKTLYVKELVQRALTRGTAAICVLEDKFYILPANIAQRLAEIDDTLIASLHDNSASSEPVDEDDPYADYVIPDDLMW